MYVIKFGDVWFEDQYGTNAHICGPSEKLAIAYDPEFGTLLRRGSHKSVDAWRMKIRQKMINDGFADDIADPTVAAFPADQAGCDFLNKVVANPGLIEAMVRRGQLPGTEEARLLR
jgi:hypothetical protein